MKELPNPHDRFFKELFSQLDTAADFVRHYLPEHLVAAIDLTTLEIVKESFIDEELRQYFSDLLLQVNLKRGGAVFIYILLEHKSAPDDLVALQLFTYLARIWQPNLRNKTKPLLLVFPVVFYHGEEGWNVSRSFNALFDFGGLESLREYAPEFKYHLCDLSKIEVNKGEARLRAGLTALKYSRSDELPSRLREIFETIRQLPEWRVMGYIRTVLKYLVNVKKAVIVLSAIQSSGKENVGKENNKSSIFLSYIFLSAGRNDDHGRKKQSDVGDRRAGIGNSAPGTERRNHEIVSWKVDRGRRTERRPTGGGKIDIAPASPALRDFGSGA